MAENKKIKKRENNWRRWVLPVITIGGWLAIILFYLPVIQKPIEREYLENLYSTSQWMIPLSERAMSDNHLYSLAGWRLAEGAGVFSINGEVPPLGKLLYGWVTVWCQRPLWLSVILANGCLIIFYGLARMFFGKKQTTKIWLSMLLLVTAGLFFMQMTLTMLDSPMLFCFLLHILLMWKWQQSRAKWQKSVNLVGAGIALGLLAAIKVPIFAVAILLVDSWWLMAVDKIAMREIGREKNWWKLGKNYLWLGGAAAVTWLATYSQFFLQGGTLWEFVKAQKYVINFYLHASHGVTWLAPWRVWITSLTGWYRDTAQWVWINEWNILWPLAVVTLGLFWRRGKQEKYTLRQREIAYLLAIFFLFNMLTSFFPRYLLLMLPWAILLIVDYWWDKLKLKKAYWLIGGSVLLIIMAQAVMKLFPLPMESMRLTGAMLTRQTYHDLYFYLDDEIAERLTWRELQTKVKQIDQDLRVKEVEVVNKRNRWTWPWEKEVTTPLIIRRKLADGLWWENLVTVKWRRDIESWRLVWTDDLIVPGFNLDTDKMVTEWELPRAVQVRAGGKVIGQTQPATTLWWERDKVKGEQEVVLMEALGKILGVGRARVENTIYMKGEDWATVELGAVPVINGRQIDEGLASVASAEGILVRESEREMVGPIVVKEVTDEEAALLKGLKIDRGRTGGKVWWQKSDGTREIVWQEEKRDAPDVELVGRR